jgi:hypothetical protein
VTLSNTFLKMFHFQPQGPDDDSVGLKHVVVSLAKEGMLFCSTASVRMCLVIAAILRNTRNITHQFLKLD